jgi:sarcosine oxidase subunit delta
VLIINCPHCGPRDEIEFACGGESHIARPGPPENVTDAQWGDYLYFRRNVKGISHERWLHRYGCGQWFHVARDTVTHRLSAVYGITEPPPDSAAPDNVGSG